MLWREFEDCECCWYYRRLLHGQQGPVIRQTAEYHAVSRSTGRNDRANAALQQQHLGVQMRDIYVESRLLSCALLCL